MYPMGNTVDNLSVYLDVRGASELPLGWSRCVQFSLTVVNQLQHSLSKTRGILFPFCFVISHICLDSFSVVVTLMFMVKLTCSMELVIVVSCYGFRHNFSANCERVVFCVAPSMIMKVRKKI